MSIKHYQKEAMLTAIYPKKGDNPYYPAMGLAGEAGEICNKIKKVMRDHYGKITDEMREDIAAELGDVLWYCAALADEFRLDLDDIAQQNLYKLAMRQRKGTLKGAGDKR